MMTQEYGKFVFECEVCPTTLETGEKSFDEAMRIFRQAGWKVSKEARDDPKSPWIHECPDCRG
jgi:hypothetical protein